MTDLLETKNYRIHPLLEGIAVGIAILVTALSTSFFIYYHALQAEAAEISEAMVRQAQMIATFIDGDTHKTFTQPSQQESQAYQDSVRPLARALLETCDKRITEFEQIFDQENGCSLIFIYTVIMQNDKVHYILDPWPAGIVDPKKPEIEMRSNLMDEYAEANPQLLAALEGKKTNFTEVYEDPWGKFISAYAPFYDSQGSFVGIVGVDMKADRYVARLAPIKTAAIRTFLAVTIIAYLMGAVVWFLRRFLLIVNQKRIGLRNAYNEVKQSNGKQDA